MSSGHVSNKMMVPAGMDAETMTSTQCLDTVAAILAGALPAAPCKAGYWPERERVFPGQSP